ncbi:unnamed protein product [Lactuca saligna]|uniref:Protein FAR1-RELATED SEQUENCE n=1 Tax=Lactuca saligna TaxID=75948 RepID=A0AA35ZE14_LACSI|nr:unnamed protein product [Lactuca saligna]
MENGGEAREGGNGHEVIIGGSCGVVGKIEGIVFETELAEQAIEPYINENVNTNDFVEATCESEELNDFGVNIKIDEDNVNDERILRKIKDDYTKFNDVVVFDVTYMTNKFKMPFAPFTGVNHHGQSILFGVALLENEKEETFEWLFEHFLKCMFGKKQEIGHLRSYVSCYNDFQETHIHRVNSDTIEQFEATWEDMCIKYELESNYCLSNMYNQHIHWAKPFLKDIFFAGITTTRRSESINSFFDGFVNSRTMLNEFVVQYGKVVESRRASKEDKDFKTMNSRPVLSSVHPIEEKAAAAPFPTISGATSLPVEVGAPVINHQEATDVVLLPKKTNSYHSSLIQSWRQLLPVLYRTSSPPPSFHSAAPLIASVAVVCKLNPRRRFIGATS